MALEPINYGAAANDGTGDSLREAMRKTQQNFDYLDQGKADAVATTQALAGKVNRDGAKVLSDNNFTNAERVKLAGSDNRANHTGVQAISTISGLQGALDDKASTSSVAQAISMAESFTAVPTTFRSWVIFVTQPHFRMFVWNGAKYVRAPWDRPGVLFFSHAPAANVTHGIQVRADVTYNKADHPDLAEILGVSGSTFVLPEGRARVLRAADNGRGIDAALVNGYLQGDAGRNLTGNVLSGTSGGAYQGFVPGAAGAFGTSPWGTTTLALSDASLTTVASGDSRHGYLNIDASRQWPTANEFRVKSLTATLYITR